MSCLCEPRANLQSGHQQVPDRDDDSFDFQRNLWSEEDEVAAEQLAMEESGPGSESSLASAARMDHFTRDRGPAVVKFNLDDDAAEERVVKVKIEPPHDAPGSALPAGAA